MSDKIFPTDLTQGSLSDISDSAKLLMDNGSGDVAIELSELAKYFRNNGSLDAVSSVSDTDVFTVMVGGVAKKVTAAKLKSYIYVDTGWINILTSTGLNKNPLLIASSVSSAPPFSYRVVNNVLFISGGFGLSSYTGTSVILFTLPNSISSRLPGQTYFIGVTSGVKLCRYYVSGGGNVVLEWTANMSDGSITQTSFQWGDVEIAIPLN